MDINLRDVISKWVGDTFPPWASLYVDHNDVVMIGSMLIIAGYIHADIECDHVIFYRNGNYRHNPDVLNRGDIVLDATNPNFFSELEDLIKQILRKHNCL